MCSSPKKKTLIPHNLIECTTYCSNKPHKRRKLYIYVYKIVFDILFQEFQGYIQVLRITPQICLLSVKVILNLVLTYIYYYQLTIDPDNK